MTAPAPTATSTSSKSLGAWADKHHGELYIGAAGLALTLLLILRRKSSTSTTASTVTAPASIISYYLPATTGAGETGSPSVSWSGAGYPGGLPVTSATSTSKTPGPVAARTAPTNEGAYQTAPTYDPFAFGGSTFTPDTLWKVTSGDVYFKTTASGAAVEESVAAAKQIEHTGQPGFPQFTTYSKVGAPA